MRAFLKEKPKYLTGPNTMHAGDYEEPLAYNECRTKCFQHENTPEEMNEVFKHIGLKPPNPLFELFGKIGADLLVGYYLRKLFIFAGVMVALFVIVAKLHTN